MSNSYDDVNNADATGFKASECGCDNLKKNDSPLSFILKGDICYSESKESLKTINDGCIVCVDGISKGVYQMAELPEEYKSLPLIDKSGKLIVPGMTDLHLHAPQYMFRGLGMDMELMDWLKTHTFPEESKYSELDYAERAYSIFTEDMRKSATTRAVVFATMHVPATELLMNKLENSGIISYVGKVNMDRNGGVNLQETTEASETDTETWIRNTAEKFERTKPIITPRFTPSCTDELMTRLGELTAEYGLPVQSHLSENPSEVEFVKELCPWSEFYGDTYDHFGLMPEGKTIMAHCVYSTDPEIELMKQKKVFIAHCPQSNINLASGIAPARRYLDKDMNIGLGTDVAGGASLSMFRAMQDAIAVSKLRWRLSDKNLKPINTVEAFYLATLGGGAFFGKVGSFEAGYEMDALVLDDSAIGTTLDRDLATRLEQFIYLAQDQGKLETKIVRGRTVFEA